MSRIQISNSDTVHIRSIRCLHADTCSSNLQLTIQQTFLDGIFKPISDTLLSHLQMAYFIPFPQLHFDKCKFTGTLVSNHLLPSSRERQTRQSNSSGSRRLNRGSCCTPKFFLSFYQDSSHKTLWTQDRIKVCSGQDISLH